MARAKSRTGRTRARRSVSLKPIPFNGDHGTGTPAAIAGTVLEPLDAVNNPNHMGRRYRKDVYKSLSLTMKQEQAAKALRDAYCRVDALSSGNSEVKVRVQSSPKPDHATDRQCEVESKFLYLTKKSTRIDLKLFNHVLNRNRPIAEMNRAKVHILIPLFKYALDRVALHMRY